MTANRAGSGLIAILAMAGTLTFTAMLRTSTTFDEIVVMAGGASGYHTGKWTLAPEHPPVTQYLFGLPVFLAHPQYPDESQVPAATQVPMGYRYQYARSFFWQSGNDPEHMAMLGRIPAVLSMLALVVLVFFFTRGTAGDAAALLAAWLTAFLPDMLAHGGVAYNDVPVAAALFAACWALDEAIRKPSWRRGILAGLVMALALGVKNTAIALAPIGVLLLAMETLARWRDADWRRKVAITAAASVAAMYVGLVLIYRGDLLLTEYRYAITFAIFHATDSLIPSFLLGERRLTGWWYFFPVAFLMKTSAALHLLALTGLVGLAIELKRRPRAVLTSRLRMPLVAGSVVAAMLLTSSLNIGFRYALPALPMVCVLTAAGTLRLWPRLQRVAKVAVAVAALWAALFTVSYYPHFHGYISEYGPDRDRNYRVLADSSLDWGQGLLELRDYMASHKIDRIYLSYFGSALPEGYGIHYLPLLSFLDLKAQPERPGAPLPRYVAISATNLNGVYFNGDPFANFRNMRPVAVLGYTIFVFRVGD
mgnify:CR=1 FL=1